MTTDSGLEALNGRCNAVRINGCRGSDYKAENITIIFHYNAKEKLSECFAYMFSI